MGYTGKEIQTGVGYMKDANVVVIGGGTGSFTLLDELKDHTDHLSTVVCMTDDGGSTGVLRDELGVLPPGDVRQCLVALSRNPVMRDLFNYRFKEGTFSGHSFGNMLLTALEKTTGSFAEAVTQASDILRIEGEVVPATLDNVRLQMTWPDGTVMDSEKVIDAAHFEKDPREGVISLVPNATLNPHAVEVISKADLIVFAPGDLYTSLAPVLAVGGMREALEASPAKKVYVANLVTKQGQTDNLTVSGHAAEIERFIGAELLDAVVYNDHMPSPELAARYAEEGSHVVMVDDQELQAAHYKSVGGNLLGRVASAEAGDLLPVTRSYIRHDAGAVARLLKSVYTNGNE